MNPILNIAIYQIVWFVCILAENRGALYSLPLLALHLLLSPERRADLKMMALLLATGLLIDGSLNAGGFFTFNVPARPIPYWLMVLWLGLATLPHHSLAWMKHRPFYCAVFGAVGGPMAYWAGVRMGAAAFNWPLMTSLLLLTLTWGLLWPGVMHAAARLDRKAITPPPASA